MTNGEGRSATWKPRLVKTPVPTMFATTMEVAVTSETVRTARRMGMGLLTAGSARLSSQMVETAGLLIGLP